MEEIVTFKGTKDGLLLIMKEDSDFQDIQKQVEDKIEAAGKFFKGAQMAVKYKGRYLTDSERKALLELIVSKSGAFVTGLEEDIDSPVKTNQERFVTRKNHFAGIQEGKTRFYKGTVRSGQSIQIDGNLVVIGDVNPGGELIATGNVVVMGSLRGIVHAGTDGNKQAFVAAINMFPTQLRIADIITRPPDEKQEKANIPEMAYVKDDMIIIDRYLPSKS